MPLLYYLITLFLTLPMVNAEALSQSINGKKGGETRYLVIQIQDGPMGPGINEVQISGCGPSVYTNANGLAIMYVSCDDDSISLHASLKDWRTIPDTLTLISHPKMNDQLSRKINITMARKADIEQESKRYAAIQKILHKKEEKVEEEIEGMIEDHLSRYGSLYSDFAQAVTPAYRKEIKKKLEKADRELGVRLNPIRKRQVEIRKAGAQILKAINLTKPSDPSWDLAIDRIMEGELEQGGQIFKGYFQSNSFANQSQRNKETILALTYMVSQADENLELRDQINDTAKRHGLNSQTSRLEKGRVKITSEGIISDSSKIKKDHKLFLDFKVMPAGLVPRLFPFSFGPVAYFDENNLNNYGISLPILSASLGGHLSEKWIWKWEYQHDHFGSGKEGDTLRARIVNNGIFYNLGRYSRLSSFSKSNRISEIRLLTSLGGGLKFGYPNPFGRSTPFLGYFVYSSAEIKANIEIEAVFSRVRLYLGMQSGLGKVFYLKRNWVLFDIISHQSYFQNALGLGIRIDLKPRAQN